MPDIGDKTTTSLLYDARIALEDPLTHKVT